MAPPPTSTISHIVSLVLKILMFVSLLVALVVLVTDSATISLTVVSTNMKIHFDDVYTYRYMLASIIFGFVYSLAQTALSLYHIIKGSPLFTGDAVFVFNFYADKVISYLLATGSAAGFGATKDLKASADALGLTDLDGYFDKGFASASLLLLAFLCAALLSIFSSYALPKIVSST
ncbi:hypothetical protein GQ457_09G029520 [Hibiscus cannabinus]